MLTGKVRPANIPPDWIGSPTRSSPGWRWDDPKDSGNSVRFFQGNPDDDDPAHRKAFVIVVAGGRVIGRDGHPVEDGPEAAKVLREHF